ncbi:hypothetical protein [Neisseria sp. HMSC064E01]|jgi:hypothetical protein|uniref:hypothetical protein n=1 Tax=Neisseria sp. HMSC064E01 TaxID=1715052 RepID=UPI0008A57CCD|nr:hypothetical protein [Neisseria sp. HMSC064E01]OFN83172.1 hypothetical protein HMPREF2572_03595 [Neisseria sp. HMSC064E01]
MKKLFALAAAAFILSACSSTWSGAKDDASRNWDKTKETAGHVADKTEEAVKKGGNAVGRGMTHVGEKLEAATE